jgi:uncharacterized protein with PIN domain
MQPRFLIDENCAQITKWLRFYGADALEVRGLLDVTISRQAIQESRILVTRDQELYRLHPEPAVCLFSDDLRAQLKLIFQKTGVPPESLWFSRCVLCNVKFEVIPEQEIKNNSEIPPKVLKNNKMFWRCPSCGKIYWKGSHFDRTQVFLREIAFQSECEFTASNGSYF